eukprot:2203991-Amphidinium_carterae.1
MQERPCQLYQLYRIECTFSMPHSTIHNLSGAGSQLADLQKKCLAGDLESSVSNVTPLAQSCPLSGIPQLLQEEAKQWCRTRCASLFCCSRE